MREKENGNRRMLIAEMGVTRSFLVIRIVLVSFFFFSFSMRGSGED